MLGLAIKILEALIPVVMEFVASQHPDKNNDEHKQIVRALIDQTLEKGNAAQ